MGQALKPRPQVNSLFCQRYSRMTVKCKRAIELVAKGHIFEYCIGILERHRKIAMGGCEDE